MIEVICAVIIGYCLYQVVVSIGIGQMLALVASDYPEVGKELFDTLDEMIWDKEESLPCRISYRIVRRAAKIWSWYIDYKCGV